MATRAGAGDSAAVDPRLLLPFAVLAEELHFGRAAARLHVTQSALSQQIQRLERQVGVRLVARAVRECRQAGRRQTTVRVGVDIDLPDAVIKRLRTFGTGRPDLLLRLSIQQQDDAVADLESGRSDLAVGWTAPPAGSNGLGHTRLTTVELHGVVRRRDRIGAGPALARAALCRRRLVMYRPTRETCVGGDFARFARPDLVGLPLDPPLVADVAIIWRGTRHPPVVDDLRAWVTGPRAGG